jgi:hypothetical protein
VVLVHLIPNRSATDALSDKVKRSVEGRPISSLLVLAVSREQAFTEVTISAPSATGLHAAADESRPGSHAVHSTGIAGSTA